MANNAVIFSNYINAYSIAKAIKKVGYFDSYLSSETSKSRLCRFEQKSLQTGDFLFFTTEFLLKKYLDKKDKFHFNFNIKDNQLIDDKLNFAEWLLSIKEKPVPHYMDVTKVKKFPILLKGKASFKEGVRVPRGFKLDFIEDLTTIEQKVQNLGFSVSDFFLQKFLENSTQNISVVGYHDFEKNELNVSLITAKYLMDNTPLSGSTGDVVVEIKDPENLLERANEILNKLEYRGVYELEFILDEDTKEYYVLEINPRFWMQHGLFELKNNILIKRYLNIHCDLLKKENKKLAWINGLVFWKNIFSKTNNPALFYFKNLFNYQYHFAPNIIDSFKYVIWDSLKHKPFFRRFMKP
jgi:hypothetical protein